MKRQYHLLALLVAFGVLAVLAVLTLLAAGRAKKESPDVAADAGAAAAREMAPALPDDLHDGGPYTGRITCLASDGEHLYAGGWHMGMFRLGPGGVWENLSEKMPGHKDVLVIEIAGRHVWVGTFQGELFAWTAGAWRLAYDFGEGEKAPVRSVRVRVDEMLVSTDGGLFRSADFGGSFHPVWTRVGVTDAVFAGFRKRSILFGTSQFGIGGCEHGVERCGLSGKYTGGVTIAALAVQPGDPPSVYVAAEGDGVYGTRDGFAFAPVDCGIRYPHPVALYVDEDGLRVSLEGVGLFEKTRAHREGRTIPFHRTITAIARHGDTLYVGTDGLGVFAVVGDGLEPRNEGLLNFEHEVVEDVLRAEEGGPAEDAAP